MYTAQELLQEIHRHDAGREIHEYDQAARPGEKERERWREREKERKQSTSKIPEGEAGGEISRDVDREE